jgi:microcystin synthetase protein McyJ
MTHELRVERFYAHGVENYGVFHQNYLNFGYWRAGETDYVRAAEALLDRVGTTIGLGADAELLDVACGMGTQDRFFASRFGCRRIEAVDLTRKHIEVAQARYATPNVRFQVGNACRLDFPDASFTHVVAIEGIVHFNTRERFFREAHRLLRPGGRLGVSDFFLVREPRHAVERLLLRACVAAWRVPLANVATPALYRTTLERAGFTDVILDVVSDDVIPGYYLEQCRPEARRALYGIRGQIAGRAGVLIDHLMYGLYRAGLLGYLIAAGRKAASEGACT